MGESRGEVQEVQAVAEGGQDHDESQWHDVVTNYGDAMTNGGQGGRKRRHVERVHSRSDPRYCVCRSPAAPQRPQSEVNAAEPPPLQLWLLQGTSGGAGAPA